MSALHDSADAPQDSVLQLIRRIEPRLRWYLCRAAVPPDDVEAMVADVVGELWCSLSPQASPEMTWEAGLELLRGVVRIRQQRLRAEAAPELRTGAQPADVDSAERNTHRLRIQNWWESAGQQLTLAQRLALELHTMEDYSDIETAAILGCSVASVRVLRHKAKHLVRFLVRSGLVSAPPKAGDAE
jgi:DNA-directed RNA polymerase specialized sigma24 family protein